VVRSLERAPLRPSLVGATNDGAKSFLWQIFAYNLLY
jgi:hypothetical protein